MPSLRPMSSTLGTTGFSTSLNSAALPGRLPPRLFDLLLPRLPGRGLAGLGDAGGWGEGVVLPCVEGSSGIGGALAVKANIN